jgi:hypothetical protein
VHSMTAAPRIYSSTGLHPVMLALADSVHHQWLGPSPVVLSRFGQEPWHTRSLFLFEKDTY